jgi:hypothetical protein
VFSSADPTKYGVSGTTTDIVRDGSVRATTASVYPTKYTVDVAVWIDDSFAKLAPDAPALALRYFEHANCVFAAGWRRGDPAAKPVPWGPGGDWPRPGSVGSAGPSPDAEVTGKPATFSDRFRSPLLATYNVHSVSLRLAGGVIRYYKVTSPAVHQGWPWIQQVHWHWRARIAREPVPRKVNLLISARGYADLDKDGAWVGVGGASNGVGRGQAIAKVDPAIFRNGMNNGLARPRLEDWWGLISAHELAHSMGRAGHSFVKFDSMCCDAGIDYTQLEIGFNASAVFSLSNESWERIWSGNFGTQDAYPDPYATNPNPVTGERWAYPRIRGFLQAYGPGEAQNWAGQHPQCRTAPEDHSLLQCRNLPAYESCRKRYPYSPKCVRDPETQLLLQPCCTLHGGW